MKTCIYCWKEKPDKEFTSEHIWPAALGGDHLPDLWRTDNVCANCNNMSGLFVDGSFIKSWLGSAERAFGAKEYLSLNRANAGVIPLNYMGVLPEVPTRDDEIAEYWLGPCGAKIVHIRPNDRAEQWASYAGGDPRLKRSRGGRAYIALTSEQPFWILVSLVSFKAHFDKAERFVVNIDVPPQWRDSLKKPDITDPVSAGDMGVVTTVISGQGGQAKAVIDLDVGERFLAKLGLAIGYKLLSAPFLATDYAKNLQCAFREADVEKRRQIPLRWMTYLNGIGLGGSERLLFWPGGWVLLLNVVDQDLVLTIVAPSSKPMGLVVCDHPTLVSKLDKVYRDGSIWITIPALGEAVGPVPLPSYIAHQTNALPLPKLVALANQRTDPQALPPCGANEASILV
jgi:hypothetical protein